MAPPRLRQQLTRLLAISQLVLYAAVTGEALAQRRQIFQIPSLPTPKLNWPSMPSMTLPTMPTLSLPSPLPALPNLQELMSRQQQAGKRDNGNALGSDEAIVSDCTSCSEEWSLRVDRDEVRVWRRSVQGSAFDEIRGNGMLRAPPAVVLALLKRGDAATIREYNPMYDDGHDLQQIDSNTKVSYGSVRSIFPFKPRDTVTRVALRELPTLGGTALLLEAVEHPAMPVRAGFVRAKIIKGMHLVQPVAGKPSMTNFTFTQQVNAGGVLPAWLMNTLIAQDSVVFVQRLGKAAAARGKK